MVTGSLPEEADAAFDAASAAFMRSVLEANGQIFANMAGGARPGETLKHLCDALCELLSADKVAVQLHESALGLRGNFESSAVPAGITNDTVPQISQDIRGGRETPVGQINVTWADPARLPSPLDKTVIGRFATMALLVLERHLGKRRQLQEMAQEREAFAGEIHDDPVQVMTAVSLQLQRVIARLPDGEDRSAIQQSRSMNDNAIERLRHVMFSLHPTTLAEDGLAAAIEAYCESFVEIEGLRWTVTGDGDATIPVEVAGLGFRLCRNALVNVVEHAKADQVHVAITCADGLLQVQVTDDGVGFDMAQVSHTRAGHLGIPHAVTLARWVAGTYTTESEPNNGTTVTIELPIL